MNLVETEPQPAHFVRAGWGAVDVALAVVLGVFCLYWLHVSVKLAAPPIEDAAMLLRYSQHFAQGHGVRWNIDSPPVDGATDMLYMLAIGLLSRLAKIDVIAASRVCNEVAHVVTVVVMFVAGRRVLGVQRWLIFIVAASLAVGPAVQMTTGCFGAPFFAMFLLAAWVFGMRYVLERASWGNALGMAALALLAGLTRPEGVLISFLLLVALVYVLLEKRGPGAAVPLLVSYALVFGVLGGAYFAWRWHYFGYPLPNPFYIKGDGHLYPMSVRKAAGNLLRMLMLVLPLLPLGFVWRATRRLAIALTFVLASFTLMWLLLSNANNHMARFQYAVVPLMLMTIPALATPLLARLRVEEARTLPQRTGLAAATVVALVISCFYMDYLFLYVDTAWGMRAMAQELQPMAGRGYTMVVTEAGALPFYSQWKAVDALGLNDAYVAHHGGKLSVEYLDRLHPEVLMDHIDGQFPQDFEPNGFAKPPDTDRRLWNQELLPYYATTHGYTLAAAWGADPCNLHLYFVRPGFADYDRVVRILRHTPYFFLDSGLPSHDYRDELDSLGYCAAGYPHP